MHLRTSVVQQYHHLSERSQHGWPMNEQHERELEQVDQERATLQTLFHDALGIWEI